MIHSFRKYFISLILAVTCLMPVRGAVKVTASLDSASIMMGRIDTLRLMVERDVAEQGAFPLISKIPQKGVVTLLGDTVEFGSPKVDTVGRNGNRITERFRVPVQVFDSGTYVLPAFVYLTASDSSASNEVRLEVRPVKVGENDAISDFSDITPPSDRSFWDWMPDWLYELWWLWLLIIIGIVAGIWFGRKYRRTGKFITLPERPQPKPWTVALERLERLKAKNLWENGMEKEYFTELTDILRDYLYMRFGINAMEMTSRQIMQTLADQTGVKEKRGYMRKILAMADYVKFAKVRPLPSDNVEAYENAVNFVNETAENETPADETAAVAGEEQSKGGEK